MQHKQEGKVAFNEGNTALKFINNRRKPYWNVFQWQYIIPRIRPPYLQKDPRMCITLPTWLRLMDEKPAVLFTYRHPLEVAMSIKHREENFTIEYGLYLWTVYNMRALQNSEELCRVTTTNEAVFNDPMAEVQRIKNELTEKCHVAPPPTQQISEEVVYEFVDPKLQHKGKERKSGENNLASLKDFGNGCVARDFLSDYPKASANRTAEVDMYLIAMGVFCDLENGKAFASDYEWPDLVSTRPQNIISNI